MAHTVVGIDLGTYAVKFVQVEVGFRVTRLLSVFEEPVLAGEAPLFERQGEALQLGLGRLPPEATLYMALSGETLALRVLNLPFTDARKIEQVVGYELEGQIVHALQDVVFDHVVCKPRGEGSGSTVLAAAARNDEVGDFLAAMSARGAEPRSLFAAPVIYQALFAQAAGPGRPSPAATEPDEGVGTRMLVDLGHRRTNVCFLSRGEAIYGRTITRGGEALTVAVAEGMRCDFDQAEDWKRSRGIVSGAMLAGADPDDQRMDAVLRQALEPLMRELRQTMASYRSLDKTPVESVMLTGGGAELPGLAEHLEEELSLPVTFFAPDTGARVADLPEGEAGQGRYTLAAAIAWAGARGQKELDLRRGAFQYRASFSVVRQKAAHLGMLGAALVVCAVIDGTMAMARLTKQKEQLQAQLKSATQELFGEPRYDAKAVALLLKKGFREEMAPIPKATAFDLLNEISKKMPSAERIKLDVTKLEIRPKKTTITGTIDSGAAVDEVISKLREIECFNEPDAIGKGSVTGVSGGAKQFTLNIASKCP